MPSSGTAGSYGSFRASRWLSGKESACQSLWMKHTVEILQRLDFFPLGFSSSSICICTLHSLLLGKNLSYNYIYIHYLLSLINIEVLLFFQNYKTC